MLCWVRLASNHSIHTTAWAWPSGDQGGLGGGLGVDHDLGDVVLADLAAASCLAVAVTGGGPGTAGSPMRKRRPSFWRKALLVPVIPVSVGIRKQKWLSACQRRFNC